MEYEFSRTENLIGKDALLKIKKSHIAVFGLGGVGGYTVEALARSGVENIDIIDNDTISITNINRQLIALHSTIGKYKTEVFKERLLDINPNINVQTFNILYLPKTAHLFDFSKYDYIVDAIDNVTGKIQLVTEAHKHNTPIISSMGTGNKTNPQKFEITDIYKTSVCPLAKVMRYELKKRDIKKLNVLYSKEAPIKDKENATRTPASIAYVPSVAGLLIAGKVIDDIIKKTAEN